MKKFTRTSITLPEELLPAITREAKAQGRNRSSFLVWLVLQHLKKLPDHELKLTGEAVDGMTE